MLTICEKLSSQQENIENGKLIHYALVIIIEFLNNGLTVF